MPLTIAEVVDQLDATGQKIVQALAIFRRAVPARGVSFLLAPYISKLSAAATSARLEKLSGDYPHLVRRETGRFSLDPGDALYVLSAIEEGEPSDHFEAGTPLFTQYALTLRAADFFRQGRKPRRDWTSLEALQPQLSEFDLRCLGHDYTGAATILAEISFNYLLRWGHYRLVVEMRERLVGNLDDPLLAQGNLGELGSAYAYLGQMDKAIECQEKALAIVRASGDKINEGVWLTNLGNRYLNLGRTNKAAEYYEQAYMLARERDDRRAQGANLGSLGVCFVHMGQMERAIEFLEQAQQIAQELKDMAAEGYYLTNLGNVYTSLGQYTRAIAAHDQSIAIARQLGSRVEEALRLGNLAEALILEGQYAEALENLTLGLEISEETGYVRGKSYKGCSLACVHLFTGNLEAARAAAEMACEHDTPQNNHNAFALLGLITLRQGDLKAAHEAFTRSIEQGNMLLVHNPQNHDALRTRGLAYCGLALCGGALAFINDAISAYVEANRINHAPGLVAHSLQLFDALSVADATKMLSDVRHVILDEKM